MIAVRMPGSRSAVRVDCVSLVQAGLDRLPERWRALLLAHRELMKFAVVGAITWFVDTGVVYALKLTVLPDKPLTARVFGVLIATIVSYILNREWSFNTRGGIQLHHRADPGRTAGDGVPVLGVAAIRLSPGSARGRAGDSLTPDRRNHEG